MVGQCGIPKEIKMAEDNNTREQTTKNPSDERTFLCLVDSSEEFSPTLRFVCRRSMNTGGRIALLYIIQPAEFQHWLGVGDLMKQESRDPTRPIAVKVPKPRPLPTQNMDNTDHNRRQTWPAQTASRLVNCASVLADPPQTATARISLSNRIRCN